MKLELVSVDVIDTNKLARDRAALPTEEEQLEFDDTWELADYFTEYRGPFNESPDADSFNDLLPKGLDCPLPYGWAYWIVVRDETGRGLEIEAGSFPNCWNRGRGSAIVTTDQVWSMKQCRELVEAYDKKKELKTCPSLTGFRML